MTREEAIKHLSEWMDEKMWGCFGTIDREAIGMAIEALLADVISHENCDQCKIDQVGVLEQQLAELRGDYETLKKAYEQALSAKTDWIPCSEGLPKHGDDILVTYSDEEVSIIRGARSKYWVKWEAQKNSNLILPIAWMPLPKPYREDGE